MTDIQQLADIISTAWKVAAAFIAAIGGAMAWMTALAWRLGERSKSIDSSLDRVKGMENDIHAVAIEIPVIKTRLGMVESATARCASDIKDLLRGSSHDWTNGRAGR